MGKGGVGEHDLKEQFHTGLQTKYQWHPQGGLPYISLGQTTDAGQKNCTVFTGTMYTCSENKKNNHTEGGGNKRNGRVYSEVPLKKDGKKKKKKVFCLPDVWKKKHIKYHWDKRGGPKGSEATITGERGGQ